MSLNSNCLSTQSRLVIHLVTLAVSFVFLVYSIRCLGFIYTGSFMFSILTIIYIFAKLIFIFSLHLTCEHVGHWNLITENLCIGPPVHK